MTAASSRAPALAAALGVVLALLAAVPAAPAAAQELVSPELVSPAAASPPAVTAEGAVVYEPAADALLYDKAAVAPRPMASTTKIMTALVAIEAGTLDDTVTVSPEAAAVGRIAGAASLGLEAGQTLPMRSLLGGLVLRSGNDAAVAVAEHVAGSEAAFVERMNDRAAELGLDETRFVNASGLTDDPAHHASPLDLARLAVVAMDLEPFADWAGAVTLEVPGLPPITNRNLLLQTYDGATGVKTGYTALAGLCLVASAERDGRTLYAVVLGSDDSYADTTALLDHGFGAYARPTPVTAGGPATTYRWPGAEVDAVAAEDLAVTAPTAAEVTWRTVLDPAVALPVTAGDPLGEAELLVEGEVVDATPLSAASDVAAPPEPDGAGARVGAAVSAALRDLVVAQPVDRAAAGAR